MGIATLGHAEILCPDIEDTYRHYHDVIGLEEELREEGRIYMRGWGDWSKYTLVLTEAEENGLGHAAFQVEEPEDLNEFARRVEEAGREVEWRENGAEPGHGEAIRFTAPGGHRIELFHEIERADIPKDRKSRLKNQPQRIVDRGVGARRIDHINLYVTDVKEASDWFQDVLDFKLRERLEIEGNTVGEWLSVTPLVHEVAFVEDDKPSLNHVAYYLKSRGDLFRAADILKDHGIRLKGGPGHHGISQANYIYHDDPSGNELELFAGGYLIFDPNWEPITWTEEDMPEALYWWGKGRTWSQKHGHSNKFADEDPGE